jgi:hypothetical protein
LPCGIPPALELDFVVEVAAWVLVLVGVELLVVLLAVVVLLLLLVVLLLLLLVVVLLLLLLVVCELVGVEALVGEEVVCVVVAVVTVVTGRWRCRRGCTTAVALVVFAALAVVDEVVDVELDEEEPHPAARSARDNAAAGRVVRTRGSVIASPGWVRCLEN